VVARLGEFLFRSIEGIAAYCDDQVRFRVVDSINTPVKAVLRRSTAVLKSVKTVYLSHRLLP
jgi:hypothetical protein